MPTAQSLIIQPYTPRYQQQIAEHILSVQHEFEIAITIDDQPDLLTIPQFYQSGKGNFWIALADDQVVGTVALLDIGNDQAAIRKMFVQPAYRGQPHCTGQKLLDTLLNWAKQQAVRHIYLGTTDRFKAAHRFYEKNRFTQITTDQLPSAFPIMAVDSRFYHYSVSR